jgi:hypothetical protein
MLVAPDALGVLHDVTATLLALRSFGRIPDAVVLSAARSDASTGSNACELRRLGIAQPIAVLARDSEASIEPLIDAICSESARQRPA